MAGGRWWSTSEKGAPAARKGRAREARQPGGDVGVPFGGSGEVPGKRDYGATCQVVKWKRSKGSLYFTIKVERGPARRAAAVSSGRAAVSNLERAGG